MKNALKKLMFGFITVLLALSLFAGVSAAAEKFVISDVNYDDPYAPGAVIPVQVTLENLKLDSDANNDLKDITVKAWLEDEQGEKVTDVIKYDVSRLHQDDEKEITINVPTSSTLAEDKYTIKVEAKGKWDDGTAVTTKWNGGKGGELEIEQAEHGLFIKEARVSSDHVYAGESLDVAVTVLNNGASDESNVRVDVAVKELGISKGIYLLNTLQEGVEYNAYISIKLPDDVKDGIYTLITRAYNDEASVEKSQDIIIESAQVVDAPVVNSAAPALEIEPQVVKAGKEAIFDIQIQNNVAGQKTYKLNIAGEADWTSASRVDPATISLAGGKAEVVHVYMVPLEDAVGQHDFTLYVKDGSKTIASIKQPVVVEAGSQLSGSGLGMAIGIIAAIAVIMAVLRFRKKENEGGKKTEKVYF